MVGNGRVDRFVWEGVCVAIFIPKACTYLCNNYFFISLYLYSMRSFFVPYNA